MKRRAGSSVRSHADISHAVPLLAVALLLAACAGDGRNGEPSSSATVRAEPTPSLEATRVPEPTASREPTLPPATPTPGGEPATLLYRGDSGRRVIALTFDAGSDPGYTARILGVLRQEGIRASFAVTGLWAEANRDLLLAIAADGHEFINHSYSHASFTGRSTNSAPLTFEERSLELSRTETTVYRLTGRSTRPYFRPPFGDIDESVLRDAGAAGYHTIVMWTVDTLGWDRAPAEQIVQRTIDFAEPGAIVVMHVGSESQDAAALPEIIARLRDDGYGFASISELTGA